jgi:hypothetical protein
MANLPLTRKEIAALIPILEKVRRRGHTFLMVSTDLKSVYTTKNPHRTIFRKRYHTYGQARKVVKRLGIFRQQDYKRRHIEDPLLPPLPDQTYKAQWKGWKAFFGTDRYSYERFCRIMRRFKIRTTAAYEKRRKRDPRLPVNPYTAYKDAGWKGFRTPIRKR